MTQTRQEDDISRRLSAEVRNTGTVDDQQVNKQSSEGEKCRHFSIEGNARKTPIGGIQRHEGFSRKVAVHHCAVGRDSETIKKDKLASLTSKVDKISTLLTEKTTRLLIYIAVTLL